MIENIVLGIGWLTISAFVLACFIVILTEVSDFVKFTMVWFSLKNRVEVLENKFKQLEDGKVK